MSDRIDHAIWLKALALREGSGKVAVIVTADLVGLSDRMITRITGVSREKH